MSGRNQGPLRSRGLPEGGHLRVVKPRDVLQLKWPGRNGKDEDRYYARCQDCDWHCHVTPHRDKEVAERCMTRHVVYHHPPRTPG
jgi:hypothetical protein